MHKDGLLEFQKNPESGLHAGPWSSLSLLPLLSKDLQPVSHLSELSVCLFCPALQVQNTEELP